MRPHSYCDSGVKLLNLYGALDKKGEYAIIHADMSYFRFLFGSPRRTFTTLGVFCALVVFFSPGLLRLIIQRMMTELSPVIQPLLTIAIVLGGLKMICGGKKKG